MNYTSEQIIKSCKNKILGEADALTKVADQVDEAYTQTVEAILACKGRVIITGLGKTGHVGKKIAASLASLGVPAFFVHSCESLHGDMGMITKDDLVIMISNSGKSPEILNMLAPLRGIGNRRWQMGRIFPFWWMQGARLTIWDWRLPAVPRRHWRSETLWRRWPPS